MQPNPQTILSMENRCLTTDCRLSSQLNVTLSANLFFSKTEAPKKCLSPLTTTGLATNNRITPNVTLV